VGPVHAARIVHHFGDDTLRVFDEEPERLQEIPGIGPARAAASRTALASSR
jgi:exodeoxyribonuclease V alpha subunit